MIQIIGSNFAESGLSSNHVVYVGDSLCPVIEYYTTDSLLVCVAPPCNANACLITNDFRGSVTVDLSVYIQTVETILSAATSYTYSYFATPIVSQLNHNSWATSSTSVMGKWLTSNLTDISIKINNQFASIGDNNQLNTETIPGPRNIDTLLYYHPPTDMAAGFYNLSLTVQNSTIPIGPGLAKLFDQDYPFDFIKNATFGYYYRSSLSGVSYLVTLFPTISSLSAHTGSVAGGTLLKIKGYGFPNDITSLVVYAAGELCQVQTVTSETITCITSPSSLLKTQQSTIISAIQQNVLPSSFSSFLNASRTYGSSGSWVKLYKLNDAKFGTDSAALLSFPWRDGLAFSMYNNFAGNNWPVQSGITDSTVSSSLAFQVEIRTTLVVPLTGNYTFYFNADDTAVLYGLNNKVLSSITTWQTYGNYYGLPSQISSPIFLKRGSRYPLRIVTKNNNGQDQTIVALKLKPQYMSNGETLVDYNNGKSRTLFGPLPLENVPNSLPDSLVALQGMNEIQIISFTFQHAYETQVRSDCIYFNTLFYYYYFLIYMFLIYIIFFIEFI